METLEEKLDPELEKLLEEDSADEPEVVTPVDTSIRTLTTMEVMARISDSKIETREFITEWLLLTFDIPTTKEGNKARSEFYKKAYSLGAIQNTESVYLCPWTAETEAMAFELASVSNSRVIVWTRARTSNEQSADITARYDAGMRKALKLIEGRIDSLGFMVEKGYHKKAQRYIVKTERLLDQAEAAIIRRGSARLLLTINILFQRFNGIFARI